MKRFARYAAVTLAMTGMLSITSQAAVGTMILGRSCGNGGNWGNGGSCGNGGNWGNAGNCNGKISLSDLLSWGKQGSWTCPDVSWSGSCPEIICPDTSRPETGCPGISQPEIRPPKPDCPEIELPVQPEQPEEPKPEQPAPEIPGGSGNGNQTGGGSGNGNQTGGSGNGNQTGSGSENRPPAGDSAQAYIQEVADLVNQERAKAGLAPVTLSAQLSSAANIRSREIKQSFSHTRPDGTSFSTAIRQAGISYQGSGENIAYGQPSPQAVMNAWMNSQGHRANILNSRYTSIGVGYYEDSRGVPYWTQLFTY